MPKKGIAHYSCPAWSLLSRRRSETSDGAKWMKIANPNPNPHLFKTKRAQINDDHPIVMDDRHRPATESGIRVEIGCRRPRVMMGSGEVVVRGRPSLYS